MSGFGGFQVTTTSPQQSTTNTPPQPLLAPPSSKSGSSFPLEPILTTALAGSSSQGGVVATGAAGGLGKLFPTSNITTTATSGGSLGGTPTTSSTTQQQPQPQLPSVDQIKYKTTICRNWEATGTCMYRGCTFAHGVDDLRIPGNVGTTATTTNTSNPNFNTSPSSPQTQTQTTTGTTISPNMSTTAAPSFVVSSPSSNIIKEVSVMNPTNSISSQNSTSNLAMLQPPSSSSPSPSQLQQQQQQQQQQLQLGVIPPPSTHSPSSNIDTHTTATSSAAISANNSFNSLHTGIALDAAAARVENIGDALLGELAKLRSLLQVHSEANKTLEQMVYREQTSYTETSEAVRQLRGEIAEMEEQAAKKHGTAAVVKTRVGETNDNSESEKKNSNDDNDNLENNNSNTISLKVVKKEEGDGDTEAEQQLRALLQSLGAS